MKKLISIGLALVLACSTFGVPVFATNLSGDVNGDGEITSVDALYVVQSVVGLLTLTSNQQKQADYNKDGKVGAVDARKILQVVVGLIEHPEITKKNEENLAKFVEAFNDVKKNAASVTLETTSTYKCAEYSGNKTFQSLIEESFADIYGDKVVYETYTGVDIAAKFPPVGAICNLTMADVKSIKVTEGVKNYTYVIVVKGEKNPTRGKGVGSVATIITQQDLEESISGEDESLPISVDCIYNDVTVKATVSKETGKMTTYSVDVPMIMDMTITLGVPVECSIGIGTIENWTIAY